MAPTSIYDDAIAFAREHQIPVEVVETREHWRDLYPFHHDLRVVVAGRRIYFETCLDYKDPNDPDDPVIRVVNAHDA